jgi:Sulfotransferase domain
VLPNLLVIGAPKCGTTSLHRYLDAHPEIAMSAEKELNFFVPELNGGRGLDWYERQFDASAPVRGESSPAYASHPFYAGVPQRIHAVIPDVRLVYLVRDPIERIVSHYRLIEPDPRLHSLEEAIADPFHGPRMLGVSRYAAQLEQYLRFFPSEQILVVDADRLRDRRGETLAQVFRFLGVDPHFRSAELDRLHNVSRKRGRRIIVTPEVRERLAEELSPDVERLRAHTGDRFAGWSL